MIRIEHIAIWCKDLERMRTFYETYFAAKSGDMYVNSAKGYESYFLTFESGSRLELMRRPDIPESTNDPYAQSMGLVHLAIAVGSEDTVKALTQRLRGDGYEVIDGPRHTGDGYHESVVLDSENNRIEITV